MREGPRCVVSPGASSRTVADMHVGPNPDKPPILDRMGTPVPDTGNRTQILLDPLREPWEHQNRESHGNFGLFKLFLDLGPSRNLRSLAELSGKSLNYLRTLQFNNAWRERAAAFDKYNQDIFVQRMADARKDAAQKHIRAADALLEKALRRLEALDIKEVSPTVLVMMFAEAAKIHRLALGMEDTPITQVNVTAGAAASTKDGQEVVARVEVTTMRRTIMDSLAEVVGRMTPEQVETGRQEVLAAITAAPATEPPSGEQS